MCEVDGGGGALRISVYCEECGRSGLLKMSEMALWRMLVALCCFVRWA